jgi:hypothetical protein
MPAPGAAEGAGEAEQQQRSIAQSDTRAGNFVEHALQVADHRRRLGRLDGADRTADAGVGAADQRRGGRRGQVARLVGLRNDHKVTSQGGRLQPGVGQFGPIACFGLGGRRSGSGAAAVAERQNIAASGGIRVDRRGTDSSAVVDTLMARKLVAEDPPFGGRGRPAFLVLATTPAFLKMFGLS